MSVSVVGDGDLYYFKQGAWRSLTGRSLRAARSQTSLTGDISYRVHTFTTSGDLVVGGVGRWT
jgi:hypothetical protein